MAQINISVTDQLKEWVDARVASGDYSSASDYVRDLIRRDREREREQKVAALREALRLSRESGVGTRTLAQIHADNRARRDAA
ncbi:MAG: type II toxin-antitoxin system ParD family antitoxin [Sphingomonas sp.]|jgi:antitoxin ParD1/3/4|uniref:type II toxin-antitoxin system ParD family antitoxin n=1 Tax=Sphingomonas sp. TaxID=28214 RepID=UPI00356371EF